MHSKLAGCAGRILTPGNAGATALWSAAHEYAETSELRQAVALLQGHDKAQTGSFKVGIDLARALTGDGAGLAFFGEGHQRKIERPAKRIGVDLCA